MVKVVGGFPQVIQIVYGETIPSTHYTIYIHGIQILTMVSNIDFLPTFMGYDRLQNE
jgi:hypothetical protein